MNDNLKKLSEKMPELGLHYACGRWFVPCGNTDWPPIFVDTPLGKSALVAAIRDWVVGQGWTVRCASGTYDGAILYMWEAGPTFHIEPLVECDNTDELLVAIDCALAVAKEKTE